MRPPRNLYKITATTEKRIVPAGIPVNFPRMPAAAAMASVMSRSWTLPFAFVRFAPSDFVPGFFLMNTEDVKRYAVEAHGVKGVMASSCASGLSATAKAHELAAKEGNFAFVKDNIDSFLAEYEDVLDYIRDYLRDK